MQRSPYPHQAFALVHRLPLLLLFLLIAGCAAKPDESALALTEAQLDWVGQQIFQNECAAKERCLVHWNEGEAFPSLGIGHFIWYPAGVDGRFVESFPALLEFMRGRAVVLPDRLDGLQPLDAPWPNRAAFLAAENGETVEEMRRFMSATKGLQVEFIFARAQAALGRVVEAAPEAERAAIRQRLRSLSATPGGTYGLIDYVNFKGEGLSPNETYQGQGWGLLQVLQQMSVNQGDTALAQFQRAAVVVLSRRAENAPQAIEKQQWLGGWINRLKSYEEPG